MYWNKQVLHCPGLLVSLYTINAELLIFARFHSGWKLPRPIFTSTDSPPLKLAMHIRKYVCYEGQVSLRQ
jgi:hypothetical protein